MECLALSSLIESEDGFGRMLAQAVHQSINTVVITDLNGTIKYVNPRFAELTGYSSFESIGQNPRMLQSGNTSPAVYRDMWETITHGNEWHGELQNKKKNGELYWTFLRIFPLRGPNNEITHYLGMEEDITQRKMLELKLQTNISELKRSNAELEGFSRVVAHDLMGPISNVIASLKMARKDERSTLSAETAGLLNLALNSADKAAQLIRDLLDYSRVGGQLTGMTNVNFNELLADVIEGLRPQIDEAKAQISFSGLPAIYCSRALIGQLFQNLLTNAIKYRSRSAPVVKITAEQLAHGWLFAVTDNGVGIPFAELARIFEPFYRITSMSHRPGTGIGLATCNKIIKAHKGRIWAESREGIGTTFYFTLPPHIVSHQQNT